MFLKLQKILVNNFQKILFSAILIVASFLRLYKIADYMTFLGDEGRDVLVVKHILEGNFTLLGPRASAGDFFLGPIYYYFMAPFLFVFNFHPVGPAVMVALFGIATVFLVYKIGKEFFDTKTAIFAASLYTVSPVVIAYSRSSWNPNLMPFFSLLAVYILYKAVVSKKWIFFIVAGILLGILMQLHYLSLFLGSIMIIYIFISGLLVNKNNLSKKIFSILKNYFFIIFGFVIGWLPFLAFEVRHGFPNIKTIISFIFKSGEVSAKSNFLEIIADVYFRVFGRLITHFPAQEQIFEKLYTNVFYWYLLTLILGIFASVLILYKLYKSKKEELLKILLIVLWFFFGLLFFGFYKKSIYDYYFAFMFPVPFFLVGYALSFVWSKGKIFAVFSLTIFIILLYVNIQGSPFRFLANRQYEQVKTISELVLQKTDGKPFNFALITGGNSDHAYRYIFEIEKHSPVTIENPEADPQRKSVTDQLFIVCESLPCQPLGHSLWEIAGFGRAEIAGEWNVSVVKVYKLIHYTGK